jgi:hypothetical protein
MCSGTDSSPLVSGRRAGTTGEGEGTLVASGTRVGLGCRVVAVDGRGVGVSSSSRSSLCCGRAVGGTAVAGTGVAGIAVGVPSSGGRTAVSGVAVGLGGMSVGAGGMAVGLGCAGSGDGSGRGVSAAGGTAAAGRAPNISSATVRRRATDGSDWRSFCGMGMPHIHCWRLIV